MMRGGTYDTRIMADGRGGERKGWGGIVTRGENEMNDYS